ncbi:hypothetical protein B7W85_02490 [Allorhizobium ampelinum]|nr:hypothetical protein [Allorhizobium ampelinum]NSZ46268.1 hypothetical protein [Agrobacterium vitis]NTA25364.1 hypothetical protein [Allorhizobium ampelinum]OVE97154.1 hypothetical protein B7W85_02490 [Allorhizobium ampelinum]
MGTLPSRAYQYCEGVAAASRQGWYVFPPVKFDLMWTGNEVVFRIGDDPDWSVLERFYLEDSVNGFLEIAPDPVKEYYPSFLDVFPEGNIVQICSGYALQSGKGVCYQVRGPVNLPMSGNVQYFEAIVDSSWYLSPLIINIRILQQDKPIHFPQHKPLMQIVPLPTSVLSKEHVEAVTNRMENLDEDFWSAWKASYDARNAGKPGSYARKQRSVSRTYKSIEVS